jgi:branched-chain amino acid transport system permease protein
MGDIVLQRQDLAIVAVTIAITILLTIFFNFTWPGRALRATNQNPRAAALIGIPVKTMRMAVWGIASALAGISGILLAPKILMTPDIVGGFTSLPGCVIGGVALGIIQNFVGVLISPQAISVTPFFVIMLVLMLFPQGLLGEASTLKKV